MAQSWPRPLHTLRPAAVVSVHVLVFALASYAAYWLRFDGELPTRALDSWKALLPVFVVIEATGFFAWGLYSGMWCYTGLWDLRNLICATLASTMALFIVVQLYYGGLLLPRSTYILNALLLIFMAGAIRIAPRLYVQSRVGRHGRTGSSKRILVLGAGDLGELAVRVMIRSGSGNTPVGFLDDDGTKIGRRIHGVKVLGTCNQLPEIMRRVRPDELLVAAPAGGPPELRRLLSKLENPGLSVKILPSLDDIVEGRTGGQDLPDISLEGLLLRRPVGLNGNGLGKLIKGMRVAVTGAGGSIGSELCRQIAALNPGALVLIERYENSLYAIENELRERWAAQSVFAAIGDVSDGERVNELFARFKPQIVFHAAAHKHVPLMELNPCEAVKNNVRGTRVTAEAAAAHGAGLFVLISTDKAVNPTSIMGVTKKIGELTVQAMACTSATRFVAVRFGNVLGSNGSVIPRFIEQIRSGGPVTVTHPLMRRFFMLIPEAVQLVLHSAVLGESGSIYVLDMGEQVKMVDVACNMIRLAGFVPYDEIPIVFTGVRPGEKLYEELVGEDETATPSTVDKIFTVHSAQPVNWVFIRQAIADLESVSSKGDAAEVFNILRKLVPDFQTTRPDNALIANSRNRREHASSLQSPV